MEIRYVSQEDDVYAISKIYEESWKYAYKNIIPQSFLDTIPSGKWAAHINRKEMHSLVVINEKKYIGTLSFCKSRWNKFSDYGEIVSIYFLPEYMHMGYGSELLDRGMEELKLMGHKRILLWVLEENKNARRFYEKHGFLCTNEYIEDEIGGKKLREVMYIKTL